MLPLKGHFQTFVKINYLTKINKDMQKVLTFCLFPSFYKSVTH